MRLAAVLLHFGHFNQSLLIMKQVSPFLLSHSSAAEKGLVFFTLTTCYLAKSRAEETLIIALDYIDQAILNYRDCFDELVDCYQLKAEICNTRQDMKGRAEASSKGSALIRLMQDSSRSTLPLDLLN